MAEYKTETGPGSAPDQNPSENEQAETKSPEKPVDKGVAVVNTRDSSVQREQGLEKSKNKEDVENVNQQGDNILDVEVRTLRDEDNTDHMNNTKVNAHITDELVDLDVEVKYNREVLGTETFTSLDDLLLSNKDTLNNIETNIIPETVEPAEVNIVKIDCTKVTELQRFSGSESVNSDINESVNEDTAKNDTEKENSKNGNGLTENLVTTSQDSLKMPETRQETEGSVSPSLMFALCRYRWAKTIVTQSDRVVFVTLNNKEIEPIKLEWTENSKCFYSEEFKIPTGKYVGNLVIDGVFYPVEDITVKHYTFEVDLYLKDAVVEQLCTKIKSQGKKDCGSKGKYKHRDKWQKLATSLPQAVLTCMEDIIEDEVDKTAGVNKAEKFLEQRQNGADIVTYTAARASSDNYTHSRAKMEQENQVPQDSRDSSIHVSSKYEDLVRSQMSQSQSALIDVEPISDSFQMAQQPQLAPQGNSDNFTIFDQLDPLSLDGRRSPVGDDGGKKYEDSAAVSRDQDRGHVFRMNGDATFKKELDSMDSYDTERKTEQPNPFTMGEAANIVVDDVLGNGHARTPVYSTETPVYSRNGSAHSSTRQTPVVGETQEFARESIRSDSLEKRLLDNLIDDSLTREKAPTQAYGGSKSGSERATPQPEQIDDVLNPADRHSPIRKEYLVGSPHVSDHGSQRGSELGSRHGSTQGSVRGSERGSAPGSGHSSLRQTPQRDMITDSLHASQEKLYTGQDFRRSTERLNGSLSGGSSHGSRPQSLTSEQELTQYYELTSIGGGVNGSTGLPPVATSNSAQAQRSGSASSLPAVGAQRQSLEKRSMTPDNHIRIPVTGPIIKSSLLPSRGLQRVTPGSNTSSRTVTPVNAVADNQEVTQLQERVMDLENTVSNIRTLLASREKEVFELKGNLQDVKDVNRSLQEELDQRRARASPGLQIAELERQYRDVVDERETLSAEVIRLKEEILRKEEERNSLNSYDPNGPQALQRKIDDLNSQILDLQEANESSVDEIKAAENKIKQLAGDNETLRATQASSMRDLEDENGHLKHEISRLKEVTSHTEVSDYRLKIELQQVKEDNRGLRERNYQLHDDNIKLKEEVDTLRKSLETLESNRKTYSNDRHGAKIAEHYKTREPKLKSVEDDYHSEHRDREYKSGDSHYKTGDGHHKTGDRHYKTHDSHHSDKDYKSSDRDYKTSQYLSQLNQDVNREKERDKHVYSYTTPGYETRSKYDVKHERGRSEKGYEEEKYTSLESSARYTSYRSVPDGRTAEKPPSRSQYDSRSLSPERPSALGPPKREYYSSSQSLERTKASDRLAAEDLTRSKPRERSRTSSAELDFRSAPLSAYSEMSKTMPALSGRSRAIYKSLSSLRARSRSRSPSNRLSQFSESSAYSLDNQKLSKSLSLSSKTHPRPQSGKMHVSNKWEDETRLRIAPDISSSSYTRGPPPTRKHEEAYSREDKGLDHRPAAQQYQDDGDVSDTATDVLVNAQPLENLPAASSWNRSRPRRGSVGSEGSNSSLDDIDDQLTAAARKRSKSADSREVLRRMTPTGGILSRSGPVTPVKGDKTSSNAGFRSVTPQPLPTQRNKSSLAISPVTMSLTHGLRPFAPRSAADLQVTDVIKFSRQGGKLSQGTIKFIGHLPGRGDIYLGVELDKEDGKHDGTFEGIRYFKCKPSKGVFVAYNKVVMAWTA